jgi:YidC/Oxa1 family membrane protein insertase
MDNRRLLLLIVFSFSLVMLWDAWQKYSQPKAASPATSQFGRGTRADSLR